MKKNKTHIFYLPILFVFNNLIGCFDQKDHNIYSCEEARELAPFITKSPTKEFDFVGATNGLFRLDFHAVLTPAKNSKDTLSITNKKGVELVWTSPDDFEGTLWCVIFKNKKDEVLVVIREEINDQSEQP